jgi:hypothetical protein
LIPCERPKAKTKSNSVPACWKKPRFMFDYFTGFIFFSTYRPI